MTRLDPRLEDFLLRCAQLTARCDLKPTTLSTKLFNDGKRLAQLASGSSDIGIGRLAQAEECLAGLERELPEAKAA